MYKKIDFKEEVKCLKEMNVCAFSGKHQRYMTVTVQTKEGMINLKYHFTRKDEYSKFLNELRRMCNV